MSTGRTLPQEAKDSLAAVETAVNLLSRLGHCYASRPTAALSQAWFAAVDASAKGGLVSLDEGGGDWLRKLAKPSHLHISYRRRGEWIRTSDVKRVAGMLMDISKNPRQVLFISKQLTNSGKIHSDPNTKHKGGTPHHKFQGSQTAPGNQTDLQEPMPIVHSLLYPNSETQVEASIDKWQASLQFLLSAMADYSQPDKNGDSSWGLVLRSAYGRKSTESVTKEEIKKWVEFVVDFFLAEARSDKRLEGYSIQIEALSPEQQELATIKPVDRARLEIMAAFATNTSITVKILAAVAILVAIGLGVDAVNWVDTTQIIDFLLNRVID